MKLFSIVISVVLFLLCFGPAPCIALDSHIEQILEELESKDIISRQTARIELSREIGKYYKNNQKENIDALLKKMIESKSYNVVYGLAYSFSRADSFWNTGESQNEMEMKIYKKYLSELNSGRDLASMLDHALMKGDCLYFCAISKYNNNVIDDTVIENFTRVFDEFPRSRYAVLANFYLARYYTRKYIVRNDPNDIIKANEEFDRLMHAVDNNIYLQKQLWKYDAIYFKALNLILLRQISGAKKELEKIINDKSSPEKTIYVFTFYYSRDKKDVIDKSFDAKRLAEYTMAGLKIFKRGSSNHQKEIDNFIEHLKKCKADQ